MHITGAVDVRGGSAWCHAVHSKCSAHGTHVHLHTVYFHKILSGNNFECLNDNLNVAGS